MDHSDGISSFEEMPRGFDEKRAERFLDHRHPRLVICLIINGQDKPVEEQKKDELREMTIKYVARHLARYVGEKMFRLLNGVSLLRILKSHSITRWNATCYRVVAYWMKRDPERLLLVKSLKQALPDRSHLSMWESSKVKVTKMVHARTFYPERFRKDTGQAGRT